MELSVLWFILVAVLFTGFFFLEGFDYGVGILAPLLGRDDTERRLLINSIGPVWDGNEVWMITAGGAMFAAFPNWYATLFSGFYLALFLLVVAIIVRGAALEFRSGHDHPGWRSLWDWLLFAGSLVPALLWGVAMTDLVAGVPIDAGMNYAGTFWNLVSPYAVLGGLLTLSVFTFHGAVFLSLKAPGDLVDRIRATAAKVGGAALVVFLLMIGASFVKGIFFDKAGAVVLIVVAFAALLAANRLVRKGSTGWAFAASGLTVAGLTAAFFADLFPRVMVSSLNAAWSLTVYNAASAPYTLRIMTITAAIMVPIVLAYQGWTYWVFRKRLSVHDLKY
ncbi:MAG: cytochrome d ubiquinol oxidase subunit II [Peptococcaceae bacterium]|nr:cytochrome d ubiquinol oxidase subunit II [Peptococcaceae bacterium]